MMMNGDIPTQQEVEDRLNNGLGRKSCTKELTGKEFIRIIKEMMNDGTTKPDTYMSISEKFM